MSSTALNRMIAENGAVPRLVEHDGLPVHLHFTPSEAPLDQRLGAEMAVALAIVVRDGGLERLRICESAGCGRVLVDLSKNRSRRYCDTQCGNRQHVAAYRRRHSATQTGASITRRAMSAQRAPIAHRTSIRRTSSASARVRSACCRNWSPIGATRRGG